MSKKTRTKSKVIGVRAAGPDHQVVTLSTTGTKRYRRKPCGDCPWRKDATHVFPAEAFRHSSNTAYDMSDHVFACHQAGVQSATTCAGFLLRGANHNLAVRLRRMDGSIQNDVTDGGHDLHSNYREMAIANGVDPDDPVLTRCRDD